MDHFGDERHTYHAGEALVVTIEMPSVGRVFEASPDARFLPRSSNFLLWCSVTC